MGKKGEGRWQQVTWEQALDEVGKIRDAEYLELNSLILECQRARQLGNNQYPFFGFPGWEKNSAATKKLPPGYMAAPE